MIQIKGKLKIPAKLITLSFDLDIQEKEVCLIIGPNGCGKTTLFDLITGNRTLDEGLVKTDTAKAIGYALQDVDNCLLPWLTIIENILLPSKVKNIAMFDTKKIEETLDMFGLLQRKDDYPYKLSGGEKQIINFIRTIYSPSDIFLFDEILSAMHNNSKQYAKEIIRNRSIDKTMMIISHDKEDISLPHNRILAFQNNTVIDIDDKQALKILTEEYDHGSL